MPKGVYPRKPRAVKTVAERLMNFVSPEPNSGCWLYTGALNNKGYGDFSIRVGTHLLAHRVAYELFNGPIPHGLYVRHKCDVPCCVNPEHLSVGTQRDNMQDSVSRGRHLTGEKCPWSKITRAQADEIRASRDKGRDLARRFGISEPTVSDIRNGRRWRVPHEG